MALQAGEDGRATPATDVVTQRAVNIGLTQQIDGASLAVVVAMPRRGRLTVT